MPEIPLGRGRQVGVTPQRHPDHQLAATSSLLTSSTASPTITSSRALARDSGLMYRRTTAHSSCCSESTMPTSRITEGRSGKIPTTSVRRRISLFNRSCGLFDQNLTPMGLREGGERQDVRSGVGEHRRCRREPLGKAARSPFRVGRESSGRRAGRRSIVRSSRRTGRPTWGPG